MPRCGRRCGGQRHCPSPNGWRWPLSFRMDVDSGAIHIRGDRPSRRKRGTVRRLRPGKVDFRNLRWPARRRWAVRRPRAPGVVHASTPSAPDDGDGAEAVGVLEEADFIEDHPSEEGRFPARCWEVLGIPRRRPTRTGLDRGGDKEHQSSRRPMQPCGLPFPRPGLDNQQPLSDPSTGGSAGLDLVASRSRHGVQHAVHARVS